MPIEPIAGVSSPLAATRSRRKQSGFSVPAADAAAEPPNAPAEASAGAQIPLLTLQAAGMADTQAEADRAAFVGGEGALGAMRGLQLAILAGGQGAQSALDRLAQHLPDSADPALNDVLRAIAQRAAVERARRD